MREVDTDALQEVAPSLGVGNPATATRPVLFDDENLQQALVVNDLIRRGRTLAGSGGGIYAAQIVNSHGGAGTIIATRDPYDLGVATGAGWPAPVPEDLDAWILSAQVAAAIGDVDTSVATRFELRHPAVSAAFGGTGGTVTQVLRLWDTEVAISGAVAYLGGVGDGVVGYNHPATRIPRDALIVFASHKQGAGAADITLQLVLGLFPAGLGQDART